MSDFSNVFLHATIFTACENALSDVVEDARIHKTFLATSAKRDSCKERIFHQFKISKFLGGEP